MDLEIIVTVREQSEMRRWGENCRFIRLVL